MVVYKTISELACSDGNSGDGVAYVAVCSGNEEGLWSCGTQDARFKWRLR